MQWNIQGFKAIYEFMELKEGKPAMICIQESILGKYVPR